MHAGEVEILGVGAGLMTRDFAEARETQSPMPIRCVLEPDAPTQDCALGIERNLHTRFDPVQRVDNRKTIEARLLDPIVARAPRWFKADRPGRLVLLAHVEEMAARLKWIERPAK